jgi:hypothetical protein
MVHTVYLDDTTIKVKESRHSKPNIQRANPAANGVVPTGYMTPEEFRIEAKTSLTKILNEHGIY